MRSKFFRSAVIYLCFLTNTIYSIQHGFCWLYWILASLIAAMLSLDIVEVIRHGRD